MSNTEWDIAYVMPNISLKQSFEASCVALVPYDDARVKKIRSLNKDVKTLLDGFKDTFNKKVKPAVLIVSKKAPDKVWTVEALVAFRNCIAIAILTKAMAIVKQNGFPMDPLFSDFFDFHPATIGQSGGLHIFTPALKQYGSTGAPFKGYVSPYIPRLLPKEYVVDEIILKPMIKLWERRFVYPGKNDRFTRVLFRSLEMAYHATSTPVKNQATIHDYGVNLSIWITALEILAHPGGQKKVGKKQVFDLLGKYTWMDKRLMFKRYLLYTEKKNGKIVHRETGNLVQRLCKDLYISRNKFTHGNSVSRSHLFPSLDKQSSPFLMYAPIIYRTALFSYLQKYIKTCSKQCKRICMPPTKEVCRFDFGFFITQNTYEKCLLKLIGSDSDIA